VELDHDALEPLYAQLAGVLRDQITSGKLRGRVPSAKTLSQEYSVSIGTAERALAILRDEKLIASASGRGHFTL
jgi:DNA-binding GntR family transcriptional regulator